MGVSGRCVDNDGLTIRSSYEFLVQELMQFLLPEPPVNKPMGVYSKMIKFEYFSSTFFLFIRLGQECITIHSCLGVYLGFD